MKIEKLAGIYFFSFLFAVLIDFLFPYGVAKITGFSFFGNDDFSQSGHARYRNFLFLIGTAILIVFIPVIARYGFYWSDSSKAKKLHWMHVVFLIPISYILWASYPALALCKSCWAANDVFYFFLTIGNFLAIHICIQAVFVKLASLLERK